MRFVIRRPLTVGVTHHLALYSVINSCFGPGAGHKARKVEVDWRSSCSGNDEASTVFQLELGEQAAATSGGASLHERSECHG